MNFVYVCMLSHVWLFATPWTVACQVPLSWNFPGKNNGLGCHFLLQGIFPTQGSNPCPLHLLYWRRTLYHWATREGWVLYVSKVNDLCSHRASCSLLFFSHSVVSDSLQPHGLQHTRLHCLSLSPRVCLNPCPLSRWGHPTIPSSVAPFSSCPQSFPTLGSFQMSHLFHQVAKGLEFQLQHQSFQWTPRTDLL